ncbi:hypothetical protein HPP92_009631 [Vanilla planifolia]|uniref:VQ domain-containing protein n=1 Tax=Vanilla planifolia TaxID=51239 RepID=A0A835R861_VANPL|nr:hypothetical protein HPP92_009861 [Vanilla planifolia]KAG0487536.1 hypothetical protein HPP92_009631 [Vanilla planifolia]
MEIGANPGGREVPSPHASPNSSSSSSSNSGGEQGVLSMLEVPKPAGYVPEKFKSLPRFVDPNPYPTTFIQADTSSFKQVVQMLTGSTDTAANQTTILPPTAPKNMIPPAAKAMQLRKPAFKLYERRSSSKNLKMICPLIPSIAGASSPHSLPSTFSPRKQPDILSPSILDLPSLVISPVTPLVSDPFHPFPEPGTADAEKAEKRAIAEKGFYLHPSPRHAEPPMLLPLFPVTSPSLPVTPPPSP